VKVVITGITATLGRMLAERLLTKGHQVLGIDRRPWPGAPQGVQMFKADIRKRPAENVLRMHRPDALIHMATVTHFTTRFEERYKINLIGTRKILEECAEHEVGQVIFIGRHTVYGASADSALYHTEDDPPLAGATFPELADMSAADFYASSALWRWPQIDTAVLRLVYTLGPSRRGTLANFLGGGGRVATVLGFDPLFHLMHERDAAEAIIMALESKLRGVFNVAGPDPVPLSLLCKVTGVHAVALPEPIYPFMLGHFGFPKLPIGIVNHVKYPIVVDDTAFKTATGFEPSCDAIQTMEAFRWL